MFKLFRENKQVYLEEKLNHLILFSHLKLYIFIIENQLQNLIILFSCKKSLSLLLKKVVNVYKVYEFDNWPTYLSNNFTIFLFGTVKFCNIFI